MSCPTRTVRSTVTLSSLVLHHLSREQKRWTLRELHRVLRSGGWLHIADWGEARSVPQRIGAWLEQLFDGYDNTSDNFLGRLPTCLPKQDSNMCRKSAS